MLQIDTCTETVLTALTVLPRISRYFRGIGGLNENKYRDSQGDGVNTDNNTAVMGVRDHGNTAVTVVEK